MSLVAYEQLPPSTKEAEVARISKEILSHHVNGRAPLRLLVTDTDQQQPIELPTGAVKLLLNILEAMSEGYGITIVPVGTELTTSQAAEMLNVSRPYLVKLIEEKKIPHHMTGKHRRLKLEDVLSYREATRKRSDELLGQLITEAQEMNMGY